MPIVIEPFSDLFSSERFLSSIRDGVFVITPDRRLIFLNEAMSLLTGYTLDDVAEFEGQCHDLLKCKDEQGRDLSADLCPSKELLEGEGSGVQRRVQLRRKDGRYVHVEIVYSRLTNETDASAYVLGIVRDMTEAFGRECDLRREIEALRARLEPTAARLDPGACQVERAANVEHGGPVPSQQLAVPPQQPAAPNSPESGLLLDPLLARHETEAIIRALRAANWQRNKAAKLMGISRSRLYRRMEALGIDPRNVV